MPQKMHAALPDLDECHLEIWAEDRQWNARETSAATQIHDPSTLREMRLRSQTVRNMAS